MKAITLHYIISAGSEQVWRALTDCEVITKWGGGPCEMSEAEGENFSLWGGSIWGKNTEVIQHKLLKQDWYAGAWPEPSKVTFALKEENGATKLELIHEIIPDSELEEIKSGWKDDFLGPLKKLVEKTNRSKS